MKVSVLGGTGKLGRALARRLSAAGHDVAVGSREPQRAAIDFVGTAVRSLSNQEAARFGDVSVLAVPYAAHAGVLATCGDALRSSVVIDATVPLDPANRLQIRTGSGRSAAEETEAALQSGRVFAAFQTVSHLVLADPALTAEVLIAGPASGKELVVDLIRSITLTVVDAGPLEIAGHLERMTALLISINKQNRIRHAGLKVTGLT